MLILLGVAVVVLGFAVGFNPLLVVVASSLVTGMAAGLAPLEVLAAFGKAFNDSRFVSVAWLVLPLIGVLERAGLQARARGLMAGAGRLTTGRLLLVYLAFRQLTAALGLTSIAGQAQTVRPILVPMATAQAPPEQSHEIAAMAAATDNIGLFFGEDIFLAVGSILLMVGFLATSGIVIEPLHLSLWAIPTALAAFAIHGVRLLMFDRRRP